MKKQKLLALAALITVTSLAMAQSALALPPNNPPTANVDASFNSTSYPDTTAPTIIIDALSGIYSFVQATLSELTVTGTSTLGDLTIDQDGNIYNNSPLPITIMDSEGFSAITSDDTGGHFEGAINGVYGSGGTGGRFDGVSHGIYAVSTNGIGGQLSGRTRGLDVVATDAASGVGIVSNGRIGMQTYGTGLSTAVGIYAEGRGTAGQFVNSQAAASAVNLGTLTASVDATGIIKNPGITIAANGDLSNAATSTVISGTNIYTQCTASNKSYILEAGVAKCKNPLKTVTTGLDVQGTIINSTPGMPVMVSNANGFYISGTADGVVSIKANGDITNEVGSAINIMGDHLYVKFNSADPGLKLGHDEIVRMGPNPVTINDSVTLNGHLTTSGSITMTTPGTIITNNADNIRINDNLDISGSIVNSAVIGGVPYAVMVNDKLNVVGGNSLSVDGTITAGQTITAGGIVTGSHLHGRCNLMEGANILSDCSDFAEKYQTSELTEAGDILQIDEQNPNTLQKSRSNRSNKILGVVSTNAGMILGLDGVAQVGGNTKEHITATSTVMGLAGVLPTKVNNENGSIKIGDFITSSSTPGVGMKANEGDPTIGVALEAYDGKTMGKVNVLISRNNGASELIKSMQQQIETLQNKNIDLEKRLEKVENLLSSLTK